MPGLLHSSSSARRGFAAIALAGLLAGCGGGSTGTSAVGDEDAEAPAAGDSGVSSSTDGGIGSGDAGPAPGVDAGDTGVTSTIDGGEALDGGVAPGSDGSTLADGGGDEASAADSGSMDASSTDASIGVDSSGAEAGKDAGGAVDASMLDATVKEGGADSGGQEAGTGEGPLSGAMAFPAPNSSGICPDPPLRLTFASPPKLGTTGKIQVFNSSGTAVASLDMSATTFSDTIGGMTFNIERPAYVDGNDAVIYLKHHALAYGQTYYVTVDAGAIVPPSGTLSITGTTTWRFSTAAAAPTNLSSLTVALNGSGPFCSVQGALDALPAKNTAATTITIDSGIYHEIVYFASKSNVTLIGQSRTGTVIEGTNNNDLNPTTKTRALVGADGANGLVVDTLTISNLTPQGGSQAEALRLETCDKCIVRNTNVNSLQDTLLWDGRIYADNDTISGNVDFVWSSGVAYFNNCIIHTVGQAGAIVQARNGPSAYGYVFVDSQLTADSTVKGQVLARIDVSQYPGSHVAYINCTMGSFISAAGWTITGGTPTSELRFWEYQSVDTTGTAINTSQRIAGSTQITSTQAASMRDVTTVLGGWTPQ